LKFKRHPYQTPSKAQEGMHVGEVGKQWSDWRGNGSSILGAGNLPHREAAMIVVWGSKGNVKTKGEGQFFCPSCGALRTYKHKKLVRQFTLYWIPLFETKNLGEFIECQTCGTPFKTSVLTSMG
jgi:predicted RNA-binding Zn-ribbon protein involved in translation (DUF1610 family)